MIIDDGWSPYRTTGPWTRGDARFPDQARLAAEMLRMNVKPGLWLRPLTTRDPVPDTFLLKSKFAAARLAKTQMRTLDPTVEGAAEQIRNDIRRLCGWGFQILKHDFSTYDLLGRWGFQMERRLRTMTGISPTELERMPRLFATHTALRESARATSLLGCNTVGHLAAGLFEVQRTGDDTSGRDWSRTRKMGVNTLAFRAAQHGLFFDIDADCVGITKAIPGP